MSPQSREAGVADATRSGFKRNLSLFDLTFIGLGAIFGSGWLFSASYVAAIAGPAGIVSWPGSFGGRGIVDSPWDSVLAAALALATCYRDGRTGLPASQVALDTEDGD